MGQVKGTTLNSISDDVKKSVIEIAKDLVDNYEYYTDKEVKKVKKLLREMRQLNKKLEYHDVEVDDNTLVEKKKENRRTFWSYLNDFLK